MRLPKVKNKHTATVQAPSPNEPHEAFFLPAFAIDQVSAEDLIPGPPLSLSGNAAAPVLGPPKAFAEANF